MAGRAGNLRPCTISARGWELEKGFIIKFCRMKTVSHGNHPRAVLSQSENNTTLWIGHLQNDPTDHFAGQTFRCPSEGQLDNIQVYTAAINQPGQLNLSLHAFDPESRSWGPALANTSVHIDHGDESHWIRFELQPVGLKKDATYGFRLYTPDAMVGIGEAAAANQRPFPFGFEWSADSSNQKGHFFSYFSLAFRVEMCA